MEALTREERIGVWKGVKGGQFWRECFSALFWPLGVWLIFFFPLRDQLSPFSFGGARALWLTRTPWDPELLRDQAHSLLP